MSAEDIIVDIDRDDLKINIHGTVFDSFIDLFIPFFKGIVVGIIDDTVSFTLETGIPYVANTAIDFTDGYLPMPVINQWVLDWETPESAVVSEEAFSIGVRGLYFDRVFGEQEPAVAVPDMPYYNATLPSQFQAYVSAYSIDAFFNSLLEITTIKGWFNSTMIPDRAPVSLTTTTLNAFLPGI